MTTLYEIIQAAKAAKGSKAKEAVLEAHKDNELLKAYLKAVYDPAISYYITKIPKVYTYGTSDLTVLMLESLIRNLGGRVLTGHSAKSFLSTLAGGLTLESQELLSYIIKRKIGDGIGETMVLNVFPGLFFVPPYMRCASMDEKVKAYYASLPYFFVQTKMDGQFAYVMRLLDGTVKLFSRNGSFYPTWLAERLATGVPEGSVLMGEMLVYVDGKPLPRKTGNGILNSILQGDEDAPAQEDVDVRLVAWDRITVREFELGVSGIPYKERLQNLATLVMTADATPYISMCRNTVVNSVKEASELTIEATTKGEEGTIWKDPNGIWRDTSSGTKEAVKAKVKFQAEYVITGYYEGEGKAAGMLGGITIATPCGRITNNVGTGFDDDTRKKLWAIRETLPGKIVTIEANSIETAEGKDTLSLFLSVFIEIRTDRTEADSYERVWEQFESAKRGV